MAGAVTVPVVAGAGNGAGVVVTGRVVLSVNSGVRGRGVPAEHREKSDD